MKKLLLLTLFTLGTQAQTLLQEGFDALGSPITLPSGWSTSNLSSPIGTQSWANGGTPFAAYSGTGYISVNFNSGSGTATINNWLFTPVITVQNGDEISFYTRTTTGTYPDRLELRMSNLGASSTAPSGLTNMGSYTTLCLTVNPSLTGTGYPTTWTKQTYVVSGLTGQVSCKFALRYHVTNGGPNGINSDYIGIDAFQARRPVNNDLSLDSVNVQPIIVNGNYVFNGTVTNVGTNAVTSYNVTWQSGGAINTHNVTGVNIAPGSTHSFTHSIPLNAVTGQSYTLTFNVPLVNGVADGDPANNTLTRNTQVASGSTAYRPLIEKFTSSTCAPCASYNNSTFNPFYNNTNANPNYEYVAYQMNWPGTGDPYYTAEGGTRRTFYGVNAITSLWINGSEYSTSNNLTSLTNHINSESAKPGYFVLTANRDFTGNNAVVNYNITPYLSGNYVLHAAVIEKLTTNNVATNGETSFKHVMMKMVPNANGTTLNLTAGTPVSGQISASLAGTFIEENTDLEVIVFIQNPTTKEVVQSFKASDALSTSENSISQVKLYPNPAQDYFNLSNIQDAQVIITDTMGKIVMQVNNVSENQAINVSSLHTGIYFVNIKNDTVNETIKFAKK